MEITKPGIPKEEDLNQLAEGLKAYNFSQVGENHHQKIGTFVKTESGEVLGGAYGAINWGRLYIDWLWCHESIRGQGYGGDLVKTMERFAISQKNKQCKIRND